MHKNNLSFQKLTPLFFWFLKNTALNPPVQINAGRYLTPGPKTTPIKAGGIKADKVPRKIMILFMTF